MGKIIKNWRTTDGFSRTGKIVAWSFSKYNDYIKCPLLAKFKHVMDLKEPESEPIIDGNLVHQLGEQFVRGDLKDLPKQFSKVRAKMLDLRKRGALTEQAWTVDKNWELCEWNDWNRAWLRMKIDVHYLDVTKSGRVNKTAVYISDYKTGKEDVSHALQEDLYAIGAFAKYPDAVAVYTQFIYTKTGTITKWKEFKPKDVPKLQERWVLRTKAMLTDSVFRPKPGSPCQWCHFRKQNGGPCQY